MPVKFVKPPRRKDKAKFRVKYRPSRFDPTKTLTIRRQVNRELTRRFSTLRADVIDLVVTQDAFGLGSAFKRKMSHNDLVLDPDVNAWTDAAREAALEARRAAAKGFAKVQHAEHAAKSWIQDKIGAAVGKLPPRAQTALRAAYFVGRVGTHTAFATWTAGQHFAERVAKERGLNDEQARRLRGILSSIDVATFKPISLGLGASGIGHAVAAGISLVPPATASYLAYSTAKNPLATYRAARGVVKDVAARFTRNEYKPIVPSRITNLVTMTSPDMVEQQLIGSLERHQWDDWHIALLHAALAAGHTLQESLMIANRARGSHPPIDHLEQTDDEHAIFGDLTGNVFCPTGPGGGIDPSCSPGGAGSGPGAGEGVMHGPQDQKLRDFQATPEEKKEFNQLTKRRAELNKKIKDGTATEAEHAEAKEIPGKVTALLDRVEQRYKQLPPGEQKKPEVKEPKEPKKKPTREEAEAYRKQLAFDAVNRHVESVKKEWGFYHASVNVHNEEGYQFQVNGRTYRSAGNCESQRGGGINLFAQTLGAGLASNTHVIAHEFMHGTLEKTWNLANYEQQQLPGGLRGRQEPTPANAPVFAKIKEFVEANREYVAKEDGVSSYSIQYWKEYERSPTDKNFRNAVHESMAETAGYNVTKKVLNADAFVVSKPSQFFQRYYEAVREAYADYYKSAGARHHGSPVVVNVWKTPPRKQFYVFTDDAFNPVDQDQATWVSVWQPDGTHVWGRASESVAPVAATDEPVPDENQTFAFESSPQKLGAFKRWLKTQVDMRIGTDKDALWQRFIEQGFKKGLGNAFDDVNRGRPRNEFYVGGKDQFTKMMEHHPVTVEKLKVLASRTYTDIEGVTQAMATKMTRILAEALVLGHTPRQAADRMVAEIGLALKKAIGIAQNEIVHAHAEGQLDTMERYDIQHVTPSVEWETAGDERVCPLCRPLEGTVLTIKEARGMMPRHNGCRCAWKVWDGDREGVKYTRSQVSRAVDTSQKRGKGTDEWGPAKAIGQRPRRPVGSPRLTGRTRSSRR